jgi:oligoribonuclease NrnB/cAMP/cGMP phosphodiesterase (DHH superfamily)
MRAIASNGYVNTNNTAAGVILTYNFLYGGDEDLPSSMLPYWVRLVDDHDRWIHKEENSDMFCIGLSNVEWEEGKSGLYQTFLVKERNEILCGRTADDFEKYSDMLNIISQTGRTIKKYMDKTNDVRKRFNAYPFTFTHPLENRKVTWLCINSYGNSSILGDAINEYDAVVIYNRNKDNWVYNIYSLVTKEPIVQYAKAFGLYGGISGGGHDHAAGWVTEDFMLYPKSVETILREFL